jgi:hypothetical protein
MKSRFLLISILTLSFVLASCDSREVYREPIVTPRVIRVPAPPPAPVFIPVPVVVEQPVIIREAPATIYSRESREAAKRISSKVRVGPLKVDKPRVTANTGPRRSSSLLRSSGSSAGKLRIKPRK